MNEKGNEFMNAVSMKQRIEACFSLFIKKQLPTTGIGRGGAGATGPRQTYDGKMLTPGMISELNAGDDVVQINPQGQANDAAAHIKLQQRMIGAGQGISYEAASRDMSQSTYSSARQGLIEDGMTYAEEDELLADVLDEIYETFIISAVLAGELKIPDFWNRKEDYFKHSFEAPPKPWIDPLKEASATKIALQTGQKTFKQIAAENGSDWRKQIDDICEVLLYAKKKHGVDLGGVILGQTKANGLYEGEGDPEPTDDNGTGVPGDGNGQNASGNDGDGKDGGTPSDDPSASTGGDDGSAEDT